jgi:hypothetical protein
MSAAQALCDAGINIVVDGDDLALAAPVAPPTQILDQIREYKTEILAALVTKPEREDEPDEHFCEVCGAQASFGYGVSLRNSRRGRWFCGPHRLHQLEPNAWLARPDDQSNQHEDGELASIE